VVAISPDGNSLATARNDGKVALWDITNPHHPTRQASLPRPDYDVHGLAFGPDGRTLATVSSDGGDGAVLWDTTNRSHPTRLATLDQSSTLDQSGKVTRVAFASDGRTLATAHTRDVVMLWDITDRSHPASLGTLPSPRDNPSPRDKKVYSLGFGPDGKTLATSGSGGTALWDTTDRSHPTRLATLTQSREGHALAFTADGLTLAYGNGDGAILWDLTERVRIVTHLVDRACSITGRGLDQGEWVRYAPGLPYRRTCPG